MFRIGFGSDIHRLEAGKVFVLGGEKIEADFGAVGHSDADVLFHAVTDALLGAAALGDIGSHFSDEDERWKNADSRIFLAETVRLLNEKNFIIGNIDAVINLEKPKLRLYIDRIRENLARILEIEVSSVSVKAKTGEKVDAVGRGEAIRVEAIVLIHSK